MSEPAAAEKKEKKDKKEKKEGKEKKDKKDKKEKKVSAQSSFASFGDPFASDPFASQLKDAFAGFGAGQAAAEPPAFGGQSATDAFPAFGSPEAGGDRFGAHGSADPFGAPAAGGDPFGTPTPGSGDPFGSTPGGDPFATATTTTPGTDPFGISPAGGDAFFGTPASAAGGGADVVFPPADAARGGMDRLQSAGTDASSKSKKEKKKKKEKAGEQATEPPAAADLPPPADAWPSAEPPPLPPPAAEAARAADFDAALAPASAASPGASMATLYLRVNAVRGLQPDPTTGEEPSVYASVRTARSGQLNQEYSTPLAQSGLSPQWSEGHEFAINLAEDETDMQLEWVGVMQNGEQVPLGAAYVDVRDISPGAWHTGTTLPAAESGIGEVVVDVFLELPEASAGEEPPGYGGAAAAAAAQGPAYTPEEEELYQQIWAQADSAGAGTLDGAAAASVLMASGVPQEVLKEIWAISDSETRGSLNRDEFYVALRLLGHYQGSGTAPAVELALTPPPQLPDFPDLALGRPAELESEPPGAPSTEAEPVIQADGDPTRTASFGDFGAGPAWGAGAGDPSLPPTQDFNFGGDPPPAVSFGPGDADAWSAVGQDADALPAGAAFAAEDRDPGGLAAAATLAGLAARQEEDATPASDWREDWASSEAGKRLPGADTRTLWVTVRNAYNLGGRDQSLSRYSGSLGGGAPQPFVMATVGKQVQRTSPAEAQDGNNYNAQWHTNNQFRFLCEPKDNYLQLEVRATDPKTRRSNRYGYVLLDLGSLAGYQKRREPLRDGNGGELEFDVRMEFPFADTDAPVAAAPKVPGATPRLVVEVAKDPRLDVFADYLKAVRAADQSAREMVRRESADMQDEIARLEDLTNEMDAQFLEMEEEDAQATAELRALEVEVLMLKAKLRTANGDTSRTLDFEELEELHSRVAAYQTHAYVEKLLRVEEETVAKLRDVNVALGRSTEAALEDDRVLRARCESLASQVKRETAALKLDERRINESQSKLQRMQRDQVVENFEREEIKRKEERLRAAEQDPSFNSWSAAVAASGQGTSSPRRPPRSSPSSAGAGASPTSASPFGSPPARVPRMEAYREGM